MEVLPPEVELVHDVSPAAWVIDALRSWGRGGVPITSIVPERFESYARIEHVEESVEGTVPPEQMKTLIRILADFTSKGDQCWFCLWDGFGFWFKDSHHVLTMPTDAEKESEYGRVADERDRIMRQAPVVKAQARDYFLFRGPISAAGSLTFDMSDQTPNIWWPDDRAWCVGTDIDLRDTLVGGGRDCIEQLVATPELNASRVKADDDINELHPW